jgi:hypothetical protein
VRRPTRPHDADGRTSQRERNTEVRGRKSAAKHHQQGDQELLISLTAGDILCRQYAVGVEGGYVLGMQGYCTLKAVELVLVSAVLLLCSATGSPPARQRKPTLAPAWEATWGAAEACGQRVYGP